VNITVRADGVEIGEDAYVAAAPEVLRAWTDPDGFAVLAAYADGTLQLGGLRTAPDGDGGVDLLTPSGAKFYNGQSGIAGQTFEEVEQTGVAVAWADEAGFLGFILRPDGTLVGSGLSGGGGGESPGENYSAVELAERNAWNLAQSAQVVRSGNLTAQRPTASHNLIAGYGQSLQAGQEAWPSLTNASVFPGLLSHGASVHTAAGDADTWTPFGADAFAPMVATVKAINGASLLDATAQAALAPGDGNVGETPLEAALVSLRRVWNNLHGVEDDASRRFVACSLGSGGKSVLDLSLGSDWFARFVDCATKVQARAVADGGTLVMPAIIWLQGEQDYSEGTSKADYKARLRQLIADLRAQVQVGVLGQQKPALFVMCQTGGRYTSAAQDIPVGQAQFELMLEDPDLVLAAPNYPVVNKSTGHLTSNGSRWMGEYFGKVLGKVLARGEGWKPLHPTRVTKRQREVLISFHVPEPPLAWDTPYNAFTAADYATKGFACFDAAGSNAVAAAEIVGETMVRLSLARDVVGDLFVRYAGLSTFNGNGNLRDSDATEAFFAYEYEAGTGQYAEEDIPALVGQPYPLHNWCVAFYLPAIDD
jgi:hypothetical protein